MAINYAQKYERQIEQQFAKLSTSQDMEQNKRYKFLNAQTINIPTIELSGYKEHSRDGSVNRGTVGNTYQAMTLKHDRDISFFVDDMDVDETNLVLSGANITAAFNEEQAIPETDSYRYSKLYADFVELGGKVSTEALTATNILTEFDKAMEAMDEAGVPEENRQLKCTPKVYTLLKQAEKIQRSIDVGGNGANVNRNIRSLDEVNITKVPSARMKTAYDFTEGFKPGESAKQINFMIYHPSAILAPIKVADVYLWTKGETPDSAFGHLYQNRSYQDLFLIKAKKNGVYINTEA